MKQYLETFKQKRSIFAARISKHHNKNNNLD